MKSALLSLVCAAITICTAKGTTPQFQLSSGDSKGLLVWRSHTFVPDGDELVPKKDYIVEDAKAGVISVCLEWRTEPEGSGGEFLTAFGAWAISTAVLKKNAYILSVERHSSESVVFTLSSLEGLLLLKSEAFPIGKGWSGSQKDLGKHITPVPASAFEEKEHSFRAEVQRNGSADGRK